MSAALLSLRFATIVADDFRTPLMTSVARVIGGIFDAGELPSVRKIQEKCFEDGVRSPTHGANGRVSYGTVDRVLRVLRRSGALTWASAYVHRWHFAERPEPGQPRVRWTGKVWRLPARMLALGATWIERHQPPEAGREATQSASAHGRVPDVSSVPIQPQQDAPIDNRPRLAIPIELQQRLGMSRA